MIMAIGPPDHLQQSHDWHRIEKMKTTTTVEARNVLDVILYNKLLYFES